MEKKPLPYDPTDKTCFSYLTVKDRWPVILTNVIDSISQSMHEISSSNAQSDTEAVQTKISEGKGVIELVSKLKYDMARDRKMLPIPDDGGCHIELYNTLLQELSQTLQDSWFTCPWLYAECYLYRLLRAWLARTTSWTQFDPFFSQKEQTFKSSGAAVYQLALTMAELDQEAAKSGLDSDISRLEVLFDEMIQMCLWGNATDLSLLTTLSSGDIERLQSVGKEAQAASRQYILRNDVDIVWKYVKELKNAKIDIVLDNAGFEFFTDLLLADFLVTHTSFVGSVVFHCKDIPWFVSDVTVCDARALLAALSALPKDTSESSQSYDRYFTSAPPSQAHLEALHKLRYRWLKYFENGIFKLHGYPGLDGSLSGGTSPSPSLCGVEYWTRPDPYWSLIDYPDMAGLQGSQLALFKGDLNYRKLTGDLRWPTSTPFETAMGPLAGKIPVLSLRTSKADVIVGLPTGAGEAMDANPDQKDWRVNGRWALISWSPSSQLSKTA